jgi:hypothetical protein
MRAKALVDALGDEHVLFIANELDPEHHEVMDHIKASGNPWTIVHPVSMMDFSFAALPPQIQMAGVVFGISGNAPIGFVAAFRHHAGAGHDHRRRRPRRAGVRVHRPGGPRHADGGGAPVLGHRTHRRLHRPRRGRADQADGPVRPAGPPT